METGRLLIAVDLDGTALSDLYTPHPDTARALRSAQELGHLVVPATARPSCLTLPHYRSIGLAGPVVVLEGARSYHPQDPSFGREDRMIEARDVKTVLGLLKTVPTDALWVENDDELYLEGELGREGYFAELQRCSRVRPLHSLSGGPAARILSYLPDEGAARRIGRAAREQARVVWGMERRPAGGFWLGFIAPGCDKWHAVKALAERFGIPSERILAFGDGENDRRMILGAGQGFVMRNAGETLLKDTTAAGAAVTRYSHDQGGVGRELDRVLGLGLF